MRNTLETRLGIFFALALIVAFVIMEVVGSFEFFRPGLRARALFATVQELNEGDPVKMGGYKIGRVEKIRLVDNKVEVTMKLDEAGNVRTDSKASVRFSGLLGQNFVSISFGSPGAPKALPGDVLQAVDQADLSTLLAKLDNVATGVERITSTFSMDEIHNLVAPFGDFLKENSPRLTTILGNVQTISGQIAEGQGTVGKLIKDDTLYHAALGTVTNFDTTATDIRGAVDQAKAVIAQINRGQGTIGKLTTDDTLYRETSVAVTNLKEILQKINQGQGTVGKIINDDTFYKNARLSLQKLDKAAESLEDQGPISLLGIAVGKLF